MTDTNTNLSTLRRPRLLVRAARHGLSDYKRDRDLRRISGYANTTNSRAVVSHLMNEEKNMEDSRRHGNGRYNPGRHVELLVAIMAESRNLPAPRPARRTGRGAGRQLRDVSS